MPAEQENFNRQIEALQRYVSDLQRQRERAKAAAAQPPAAPEPPGRPSRRWLLLAGLLVVLALVGGVLVGAVAWSDDRPATSRASAGTSPATPSTATTTATATVAPIASSACKTAVDRANTMLAIAVKLREELAAYSRIMRDPSIGDLPGREVVQRSAPALRASSGDAARFDQALADYRRVVDQCRLRPP
jgi:hypothetical protein